MPARCPQCGEEALTVTARFCVGCGGPLPEPEPGEALGALESPVDREPPPRAPDEPLLHLPMSPGEAPPPAPPRPDAPRFTPRPARSEPSRTPTPPPAPPPNQPAAPPEWTASARPSHRPQFQPLPVESGPIVPVGVVVAGIIGLLALLLVLLLAA